MARAKKTSSVEPSAERATPRAKPRPYRKVEVGTWFDDRFQRLSAAPPSGQTLWLYLLMGPRTNALPGIVVAREAVMADDLGWSVDDIRYAFAEATREGMANADWKAGVVVLTRALFDSNNRRRETAKPTSLNVIKAWSKAFDAVPDCALKYEYLQSLKTYCDALPDAFADVFADAFADAFAKASRMTCVIQESGIRKQETGEYSESARAVSAPISAAESPAPLPPIAPPTGPDPDGSDAVVPPFGHVLPPDPATAARGRLITQTWRRLNEIRAALAGELGQQVFQLSDQEHGCRVDLGARIREVTTGDAEARCDHALAVLEAEARAARSIEWLAGKSFSPKAWARLQAAPKPAIASAQPPPADPSAPLPAQRRRPDVERNRAANGIGVAHYAELNPKTLERVSWWLDVPGATIDGPAPGEREWTYAELTPWQWQQNQRARAAAAEKAAS